MQAASPSSPPAKYGGDVNRLSESDIQEDVEVKIRKLGRSWSKLEESVEFDEEDEDFSFACLNAQGSPITADEAFEDGQIRPVFPLFNQNDAVSTTDNHPRPRLRKVFGETELEPSDRGTVEEASPETCQKSNSTGFSKLWRFRDLMMRSNSDGRDAFVFLKDKNQSVKLTREDNKKVTTTEKKKKTKTKSAHEELYMRNRAMKEEGKHKSYLPYKQFGFFTNVSGLSKNIHPF